MVFYFFGFFCKSIIVIFEDVQDLISRFSEKTLGSSSKVQIEFCNKNILMGNTKARIDEP